MRDVSDSDETSRKPLMSSGVETEDVCRGASTTHHIPQPRNDEIRRDQKEQPGFETMTLKCTAVRDRAEFG